MEFHINTIVALPVEVIERAVQSVDPSAVVDFDASSQALRISAALDAAQLASIVSAAGFPLSQGQVAQVASTCCGGCSS